MSRYWKKVVEDTEKRYERLRDDQVMEGKNAGACLDPFRAPEVKFTTNYIRVMTALYYCADSRYFKTPRLKERIDLALDFVARMQRPDGLFDLIDCNFSSGPDTGFTLIPLIKSYRLALKEQDDAMAARLRSIIEPAIDGMMHAGFHTPNHRWAICASLLGGYRMFGKEAYLEVAKEYLQEGIDCTEYGEYTERSAGGYNIVNNEALLTIAEAYDSSYYQYPCRNLTMMLHYIEPDGYIFTSNSTRQDKGKRILPSEYFSEYLEMGFMFHNQRFLEQANAIWDNIVEKGAPAPDVLIDFMIKPQLLEENPYFRSEAEPYNALYAESGIARISKPGFSCTILEKSSTLLYFQSGSLRMSLKLGIGFYQHREFRGEKLVQTEKGYHLEQQMDGWYYRPFHAYSGTSDWNQMDHSKREVIPGSELHLTTDIELLEDGVDVIVKAEGIDRAMLKAELGFDPGGTCETEHFIMPAEAGQHITVKDGLVKMRNGADVISVGQAFYDHNYVDGKFNSEGRNNGLFYVYFTDSTPFEHRISIRRANEKE